MLLRLCLRKDSAAGSSPAQCLALGAAPIPPLSEVQVQRRGHLDFNWDYSGRQVLLMSSLQGWQRFVRPLSRFNIFFHPILLPPSSYPRCWSLINILHPKFPLSILRTHPVPVRLLHEKNGKGHWPVHLHSYMFIHSGWLWKKNFNYLIGKIRYHSTSKKFHLYTFSSPITTVFRRSAHCPAHQACPTSLPPAFGACLLLFLLLSCMSTKTWIILQGPQGRCYFLCEDLLALRSPLLSFFYC